MNGGWKSTTLRFSAQIALFIALVVALRSLAVLSGFSNGPSLPSLCNSSTGRLPGRLRGYLCSAAARNQIIVGPSNNGVFGVSSSVHVIHLARRIDRFNSMERLRSFLAVQWNYEDALEKTDPLVDAILNSVRIQRSKDIRFEWPSMDGMTIYSADNERPPALNNLTSPTSAPFGNSSDALLCATGDDDIPHYEDSSTIPFHMILSRGMVACWFSHLQALRKVVQSSAPVVAEDGWADKAAAIVFEDDVDVESDIERRLKDIWSDLPRDWDLLFLGHCWSNESFNPPISPSSPIHPSNAPRCTHAYALSPRGARRLLLHLTYPPFAYSRALDQAFAHLIQSGRIHAYSVVPSIVIQRRDRNDSDIWASREGSGWKETLENSAFEEIEKSRNSSSLS